jgi:phenylacetate-CoA ligase
MLRARSIQERSCAWSRASLKAHQARQTEDLRRFAMQQSPFYARFHRGMESGLLTELPILTKATMMESFDELVTDRSLRLADLEAYLRDEPDTPRFRGRYVVLATSGSTGRRGVFVFDNNEWIRAMASIARPIAWVEKARRRRRPPRAALIASTAPWHYSARIGTSLGKIIPSLRLDAAAPIDELVRELNRWQPRAIAVYPSTLSQLAAKQASGELQISLEDIGTSAELLTPDVRQRAERIWGAQLRNTYGATEYAPIASECERGRMHLFEDGAIIEVVDSTGRAVPDGEVGERLLLTVFKRYTQPLIRYEISDRLKVSDDPCPCGRPQRVMLELEGRREDILNFPRAGSPNVEVAIHPNQFVDLLERVPLTGWQVIQEEGRLTVSLMGRADAAICEQLTAQIRRMLDTQSAMAPAIIVHFVDKLQRGPTGKAPLIVSRSPGS